MKVELDIDVVEAARERISWVFDQFRHVYLSGPSGKDSGVMMHLACQEARRRGRKIGVLYIDLEAQYRLTIDFVREMFSLYADVIEPYWVALPLHLRNAVSMAQPYWICWDPEAEADWVRQREPGSISDPARFPFYRAPWVTKSGERTAMEFEEFIAAFGHWYGKDEPTACLVGIRSDESLNRWRAICNDRRSRLDGKPWTTWRGGAVFAAYPIYDWRTEDVWTYFGRERLAYPKIYDLMYRAGLSIHQMRICQPYGDDQRRGLGLYHVLEPETWSRVVARVMGANGGALYAGKAGNILGNGKITKPPEHTWQSFARFLLASLPEYEREHYEHKIAVFCHWYEARGYSDGIPDEADPKEEAARKAPSWRRVCKAILRNDRMCRSLGFSQHRSGSYENYRKRMAKRRTEWATKSAI
jgi:predicted phosphoadenosine phosphosulfate sulfurtransferase